MLALIDADILVYRVGFTTNELPPGIALARMDETIGGILRHLNTTNYKTYITSTDKSNFRYDLDPQYKAGRTQPKPEHYDLLRNHLIMTHGAEIAYGQEADDELGIDMGLLQAQSPILVSIDKDLDQITGTHFNFVRGTVYDVTPLQGLRTFYTQLLTGDTVDNVKGIYGIGPKKAANLLDGAVTEAGCFDATLKAYLADESGNMETALNRIQHAGSLLKIRTYPGEQWLVPSFE